MLLILNEEESNEKEATTEDEVEEVIEQNQLDLNEIAEIELRVITVVTSKGTMKLKGHMSGREVILLIDSGVTNNFISQVLVEELRLGIDPRTQFGVTIGDSTRCEGKGICKRVKVKLKELTVIVDFLAVELGNVDLVLGMQLLDSTGTMKVH